MDFEDFLIDVSQGRSISQSSKRGKTRLPSTSPEHPSSVSPSRSQGQRSRSSRIPVPSMSTSPPVSPRRRRSPSKYSQRVASAAERSGRNTAVAHQPSRGATAAAGSSNQETGFDLVRNFLGSKLQASRNESGAETGGAGVLPDAAAPVPMQQLAELWAAGAVLPPFDSRYDQSTGWHAPAQLRLGGSRNPAADPQRDTGTMQLLWGLEVGLLEGLVAAMCKKQQLPSNFSVPTPPPKPTGMSMSRYLQILEEAGAM